jgi:thioredoxin-dependent peroxiredoxin
MTHITLKGAPTKILGALPSIGTPAPDFTVTKTDLGEVNLKNYLGKKIVLNIFPSLDTPTCALAMQRFNDIALKNKNVLILCISADLPFAQNRFCGLNHLENIQPVSIFRHPQFGKNYGVEIIDGPLKGLLARAVVIINEQGNIIYTEQVKEITEEPNYQAMLLALDSNIPNLKEIIYQLHNNPSFSEAFKKNREQALKEAGIHMSADDLQKILAMPNLDPSKNEKLDERINK